MVTAASTAAAVTGDCRLTTSFRAVAGGDSWENVTTACLPCNVRKGNRTPREAGMPLARQPQRPLSGPGFEVRRLIHAGQHREWAKYVEGLVDSDWAISG